MPPSSHVNCRGAGRLGRTNSSAPPEIPLDFDASALLWDAYAAAFPKQAAAAGEYTVETFGDSPALAEELLALVLDGRKRATSSHVADYVPDGEPLPRIGAHWIACGGGLAYRVKNEQSPWKCSRS